MAVLDFIRFGLTGGCLFGLYLMLSGQASADELIAGAVTAAAGTILSIVIRRSSGRMFEFRRLTWVPVVGTALLAVPREVASVGVRLVARHPRGGAMETQPLSERVVAQDAMTARAIQILASSLAPNRYVISLVKDDRLLLHRLVGPRPRS